MIWSLYLDSHTPPNYVIITTPVQELHSIIYIKDIFRSVCCIIIRVYYNSKVAHASVWLDICISVCLHIKHATETDRNARTPAGHLLNGPFGHFTHMHIYPPTYAVNSLEHFPQHAHTHTHTTTTQWLSSIINMPAPMATATTQPSRWTRRTTTTVPPSCRRRSSAQKSMKRRTAATRLHRIRCQCRDVRSACRCVDADDKGRLMLSQ